MLKIDRIICITRSKPDFGYLKQFHSYATNDRCGYQPRRQAPATSLCSA